MTRLLLLVDYCRYQLTLFLLPQRILSSLQSHGLGSSGFALQAEVVSQSVTSQSLAHPLRQAKSFVLVLGRPITSTVPHRHFTILSRSVGQSVSQSVIFNHQITRLPQAGPTESRLPSAFRA